MEVAGYKVVGCSTIAAEEEVLEWMALIHKYCLACPRLNMVLDPVLVCISGLWVHMLWAWSLLFTHVDFVMVCWYASCVFVLAAIICAFTQDVGSCSPSYASTDLFAL